MPSTMPTVAITTGPMTAGSCKSDESPSAMATVVAWITMCLLVPCIPGLGLTSNVVRLPGFEAVADSGKAGESPGAVSKVVAWVTMYLLVPCIPGLTEILDVARLPGCEVVVVVIELVAVDADTGSVQRK